MLIGFLQCEHEDTDSGSLLGRCVIWSKPSTGSGGSIRVQISRACAEWMVLRDTESEIIQLAPVFSLHPHNMTSKTAMSTWLRRNETGCFLMWDSVRRQAQKKKKHSMTAGREGGGETERSRWGKTWVWLRCGPELEAEHQASQLSSTFSCFILLSSR